MGLPLSTKLKGTLQLYDDGNYGVAEAEMARLEAAGLVYNVKHKEFGAKMDGSDDSEALEYACIAANETGGIVQIPRGDLRTRTPNRFTEHVGFAHAQKSGYVKGAGPGLTRIIWDPIDLGDDPFTWQPDNLADYITAGGISDLMIYAPGETAAGKAIKVVNTNFWHCYNVTAFGFFGVGGVGFWMGGNNVCQNNTLMNCHFQQCRDGMQLSNVAVLNCFNVMCDQNRRYALICNTGSVHWFGGMIQHTTEEADAAVLIAPAFEGGFSLYMYTPYFECNSVDYLIKALQPVHPDPEHTPPYDQFTFGGRLELNNLHVEGGVNDSLVKCESAYQIRAHAWSVRQGSSVPRIKAINSSLIATELPMVETAYVLDAATRALSSWNAAGKIVIGDAPLAANDAGVATLPVLGVGGVTRRKSYTTAQRQALPAVENTEALDSDTKRLHRYIGGKWRSDLTAREILGALNGNEWDVRFGVDPLTWRDYVRGILLTASGAIDFLPDGAYFGGHPVWKFVAANAKYMQTDVLDPPFFPNGGSTGYLSMLVRMPTAYSADEVLLQFVDDPISVASPAFIYRGASGVESFLAGGHANDPLPVDTAVHLHEWYLRADGVREYAIDLAIQPSGGGAVTFPVPAEQLYVGAAHDPAAYATMNLAHIRRLPAAPSLVQRAQLFEVFRADFNF